MKPCLLLLVVCILFSDCTKQAKDFTQSGASNNSSVTLLDTTRIPINDLGEGTYRGVKGGLYPAGVNTPSGQYAKDLRGFARSIVPLNASGVKDSGTGSLIAFISLGASTGGQLFQALKAKTLGNPKTNPFLKLASASNGYGSGSFNSIMNPLDPYWLHVAQILRGNSISNKQVQVIYIESEDSTNVVLFATRTNKVKNEIEACLRLCKTTFPNLKIVYFQGRTTTFDKTQIPAREPSPYYNGWAGKFAIQDQINGVAGMRYKGDSAVAPMLTWGWYQWADGTTTPRQDGFVWTKDLTTDGMHGTDVGLDTLSNRFQNFLLTDAYASIWYKNHTKKVK